MKIFITVLTSIILISSFPVYSQEAVSSLNDDLTVNWRESYFSGKPLEIGQNVQYLFDDYMVEDRFGLKRVIGPVEKYKNNPLFIDEDKPWELSSTSWSGAYLRYVIYDPAEKLYKGWYLMYRYIPGIETGYNYSTLYAESKDGISWKKPELDFYVIDGRKTNIVLHKENGTAQIQDITLDTQAKDPQKRYAALVKMIPPGEKIRCIVLMFSPDGRKWDFAPEPVLFRGANDGSYSMVRDTENDRWLLFRRPPTNALIKPGEGVFHKNPLNPESGGMNIKRRVSVSVSKDLKTWSYPRGLQVLDEMDDAKIGSMGNAMDIDQARVINYGGVYIGFIHLMDNLTIETPRECHMMWSRDGFQWQRHPLKLPFIQNGGPGEWDSGGVITLTTMSDDKGTWIYYTGTNTPQGEKRIPSFTGSGRAFVGRDRWVGQQASAAGGYLLTRQFILEGNRLVLNFKSQVNQPPPNWKSLIKAELLQAQDDQVQAVPYPGFTLSDCDGITEKEGYEYVVTWKGTSDLSTLKGKPVYIRFYLQNTTLYTFRISD